LPNKLSEATDPDAADSVYDACTRFLRERTRDKTAFRMVFIENVNYGLRRNLWAMKAVGITLSLLGAAASLLAVVLKSADGTIPYMAGFATILNSAMLTFWLLRITPVWVRIPAFAYAEQLLAACESVQDQKPNTESKH